MSVMHAFYLICIHFVVWGVRKSLIDLTVSDHLRSQIFKE